MRKIQPKPLLKGFLSRRFPRFHPLMLGIMAFGFLGNWLKLPMFFGVDFLFGSIAVLINVCLFGIGWGTLSAALVGSVTWKLWGHPYAVLIFTLEALFVGVLLRRRYQNIVLLDSIYWLILGMPLVWLCYYGILEFSLTATAVIMLKQAVNGIFNALVASLILYFTPLPRWSRRSPLAILSLRQMVFNLLVAFVFFPVLFLAIYSGHHEITNIEAEITQELNLTTVILETTLKSWYQQHLTAVKELAEISTRSSTAATQQSVQAIRQAVPSFLKLYVTDAEGTIVAADSSPNEAGESPIAIQVQDQATWQAVRQSSQPVFRDVHQDSTSPLPYVSLAVPLLQNNQVVGMAYGTFDLKRINELLTENLPESQIAALLLSQDQQVIAKVNSKPEVFTPRELRADSSQPVLASGVEHWLPPEENLPLMARWRESYYVLNTDLDVLPWGLRVRVPAAPHIIELEYFYIQTLGMLLLIAGVAFAVAVVISRWVTLPLQRLTQATTDLPQKLFEQQSLELPPTKIIELASLAKNFDSMSHALTEKFQEIQTTKENLEHRVKERTQQLLSLNEELAIEVVQRKQIEAELRDREERYEMAIAGTNDGLWDWDLLTNQVYYSPSWLRIVGYENNPLTETLNSWLDLVHPDDLDATITTINHHLEGKTEYYEHTHRLQHRQGHDLWITVKGRCDRDESGKSYRMVGVITDITDKKQAEQQLRLAKEEAELANRSKSEFLATMSHEIRTPMNAVIGMTGLLLDTPLTHQQREFVEIVRNSGDALLTIINDILDFSKIESGKLDLEEQPFDLRTCIEASLDLVAPKAAEKKLELAYLLAPEVPAVIRGDVTRLRQILVNLLTNAVKFTTTGEVVITVTQATQNPTPLSNSDTLIHFAVRDTGIGIPTERMDRLFKAFSQVDASTTRQYGGTGLGLVISQRLAQMMGGKMWVESEVGVGSTFYFTITATSLIQSVEIITEDVAGKIANKRVLIVDDYATNRQVLTLQTLAFGMQPQAVASGEEALTLLRAKEKYDVAILDMQMPKMDGQSLAQMIHCLPEHRELPLIMLTSLGQSAQIVDHNQEFVVFLNKPVKQTQLYTILVQVLTQQDINIHKPLQKKPKFDPKLAESHPLKILLAEDNVVNQKVALNILKRLGYRADVVANGLEVLQALNRQSYDVILMDVQMPELDGLTATRQICQQYEGTECPWIIAMTANAMQGDREACFEVGMNDYVSKPIRVDALIEALKKVPKPALPPSTQSLTTKVHEQAILDPTALEEIRGFAGDEGNVMLAELLQCYLEDAPGLIQRIREAVYQGNDRDLATAAHTLKSSSASLGAIALSEVCRQLENLGRNDNLEGNPPTPQALEDLISVFNQTKAALQQELEHLVTGD
jgi:PAS domain S-box-containing protein